MTELRGIAKILKLKGSSSDVKYQKKNKHILINDIEQRL